MKKNKNLPAYFILDTLVFGVSDLNYFDIVVYAVISGLANNEKNCCFASNKYLCSILNCKVRALQRSLAKLAKAKLIEVKFKQYSRIIKTNMNINYDLRKQQLEELQNNRPRQELIDYDWLDDDEQFL